jgi:GNAT superfamily N-acetyltransferase
VIRNRHQMVRPLTRNDCEIKPEVGRKLRESDTPILAELMLDAYRGTIDDEGETIDDAIGVVESLFGGAFGALDHPASVVFAENGRFVASTLITHHEGCPLVAFSMTHPSAARRGLARRGLRHAIGQLARAGCHEIRLVGTRGNSPAEALYLSEGFAVVTLPA